MKKVNFYYKFLIFLFSISLLLTYNKNIVNAQATDIMVYCDGTQLMWADYSDGAEGASSDDLIAQNITTNLATSGALWGWGTFPQYADKCMANILAETSDGEIIIDEDGTCFLSDEDRAKCAGLSVMDAPLITTNDSNRRFVKKSNGLVGLAYHFEQSLDEPIPLNMAYFLQKNAQKIPVIKNTAYAQVPGSYTGPMVDFAFKYWTITRNIAYALMAIIMLVVGIMIITQKKLDAKTSITVQQALPQVMISIVLIYLSYPIGATAASLAYGLLNSSAAWAISIFALQEVSVPAVSSSFGMNWLSIGSGITGEIGKHVTNIASAVYHIIVLLKIFGIYLRLLLGVIISPLVFATGAIPGQEKNIVKWFKQLGANVVAIPVTMLAFEIVKNLGKALSDENLQNYNDFSTTYAGTMLGGFIFLLAPGITIMGLGMVAKLPSKIDELFGVSKK